MIGLSGLSCLSGLSGLRPGRVSFGHGLPETKLGEGTGQGFVHQHSLSGFTTEPGMVDPKAHSKMHSESNAAQRQADKPQAHNPKANNPINEMVTRLLGLLKEAKMKWHPEPNSPEVPPRLVVIDPKMTRPDGTHQPYGYYFYSGGVNSDGTEKEGYLTIKGLLQSDRYGHPLTRSEMGEEAFQAIQTSVAENTVSCKP